MTKPKQIKLSFGDKEADVRVRSLLDEAEFVGVIFRKKDGSYTYTTRNTLHDKVNVVKDDQTVNEGHALPEGWDGRCPRCLMKGTSVSVTQVDQKADAPRLFVCDKSLDGCGTEYRVPERLYHGKPVIIRDEKQPR